MFLSYVVVARNTALPTQLRALYHAVKIPERTWAVVRRRVQRVAVRAVRLSLTFNDRTTAHACRNIAHHVARLEVTTIKCAVHLGRGRIALDWKAQLR